MKYKSIILPTILGIIAGPLQMGIIYLLIGKNETNNLFVFIGLLLAFIIIYKIFVSIFYWAILRGESYSERAEYKTRTNWISKASFLITYFVMLYFIAGESLVTSIILSVVMVSLPTLVLGMLIAPFADYIGNDNTGVKQPTNQVRYKRAYFKDMFGNITGTADTVSYKGKYGSYEITEYKDKNGKVIGRKE